MPILGDSSSALGLSKAVIKPGIFIPEGALDIWKAARNNAANELVEVVAIGDSTTWGSGPAAIYSWLTKVRQRSIAAGYTDGGKGLINPSDDIADYTDIAGEVQGVGATNQWNGSYPLEAIVGGGTFKSSTAGQQILFQGKGNLFRIYYARGGGTGDFTYSVDGGATVTVATNGSGSYRYIDTLYVGGLTDTTHTLLVTNMGGRNSTTTLDTSTPNVALTPTIHRDKGIVYHKNARSGSWFPDYFDSTASNGGWSNTLWRPLTALGLATPTSAAPTTAFDTGTMGLQQAEDTHPQHPRCRLAILHLGFNDLTNMTTAATAQSIGDQMATGVTAFCRMAKNAGASALVLSGQLPANGVFRNYGGRAMAALRDTALANGAAWADVTVPLGNSWGSNPHLTKAQYQSQGDWLWDNVLSL